MESDEFLLENDWSELIVSTDGGQVLSWKNHGKEILYQGSSNKRTGIPILFPFANPLDDNIFKLTGQEIPQHGFARNSKWAFEKVSSSVGKLSLNSEQIDLIWQKAYPFKFNLCLILDISQKNQLKYKIQVENLDIKDLPIAPGIHPYFPIKHEAKKDLIIEDKSPFTTQEKYANIQFPLDTIDWEKDLDGNFFTFNGKILARFPDSPNLTIEETSETIDFRFLVIWSQNSSKDDSDFVCLEPFTRFTNALNDSPILVKPGEIWEKEISFTVEGV